MPTRAAQHHPAFWRPYVAPPRRRTDDADRYYGTMAWRRLARECIELASGLCAICGRFGADTADHIRERRDGGADELSNLRAVHRSCHAKRHAFGKGKR